MTFSSSARKRKPGIGQSRAYNKHVWFHPDSQHKTNEKPEDLRGYLHFDSELEFTFWLFLSWEEKQKVWIHHQINLVEDSLRIQWKPDFYFPLEKTIVEVKGEWINAPASSDSKALLIVQIKLAIHTGYRVILASNKEFSIGEFATKTIQNWRK